MNLLKTLVPVLFLLTLPATAGLAPAPREFGLAPDLFSGTQKSVVSKNAPLGSVILFLSAQCPCSRSHEEPLARLAKTFGPKGFHFTAILANADENEEAARTHFRSNPLPFPILRDSQARLADALGANRTPHAFVLSTRGEILFQGGVDDAKDAGKAKRAYLQQALEEISQGKLPEVREARSLGCRITRPAS
jgi:hypothetical protein